MGNKPSLRITVFLLGIGLILSNWVFRKVFVEPLEGFTKGRVYLLLALTGITILYVLWDMYVGVKLPELEEGERTGELPESRISSLTLLGPEDFNKYRKAAERYNRARERRKEKKDGRA